MEAAIDDLVSSNKLEIRGNDSNKIYFIITHRDHIILFPQTHQSGCEKSVNEITIHLSNETSNFDETSQTSPQTINFQSSYEELVISSRNYYHLRIFSHRLEIS